jgi:anti-sigma factor RsiW
MALSCRELVELLGAYRDRSLVLETTTAVEAHLLGCEECTAYLASYEETIRLSKSAFARHDEAERPEPSDELVHAIVSSALRSKYCIPR